MHKLILVKHSLPEIDETKPAKEWGLGFEGRVRCKPLADQLMGYHPDVVISSVEPKAYQTARVLVGLLDEPTLPWETMEGLHEHDRSDVRFLDRDEFEKRVAEFFAKPSQKVFGAESADEAHDRFAHAINGVIEKHGNRTIIVVAHGTVISLFVSRLANLDPFSLWKSLDLPSYIVLSLPDFGLLKIAPSLNHE
ncbi:MAG: histidine phosphatase family protein [Chloroflexota bacterium]